MAHPVKQLVKVLLQKHCCSYKSKKHLSLVQTDSNNLKWLSQTYEKDCQSNITDRIISHVGKNIYLKQYHPLSLVRQRIINFFYKSFLNRRGNPLFSVHENLTPVVSTIQNFDSLLIPEKHPSRCKSDCYYINKQYMLRAHMTAHQSELIQAGLSDFIMIGDVYRRDEIDRKHYPVFHQVDIVRLKTVDQLFVNNENLQIFEEGNNESFIGDQEKQSIHSLEAVKLMEYELKTTLVQLAQFLFGDNIKYRWVNAYFPFTQPSWELEVYHDDDWMELLGCGIMQQKILSNAGVNDKIGWALGLGLERIAMCLYKIPDIRLFWSEDSGFLNQFVTDDVDKEITYIPISQYPQCINDISFWLPNSEFSCNDFYDLARSLGGDLIEQVRLIDTFIHPKNQNVSHCYRIVYRHMERTLTQAEVNIINKAIQNVITELGGKIR